MTKPSYLLGLPDERVMNIGTRWAACHKFQCMPGMLAWYPRLMNKWARYTDVDIQEGFIWIDGVPDLRDPATLGWLLSAAGLDGLADVRPRWAEDWPPGDSIADAAVGFLESLPVEESEFFVYLDFSPSQTDSPGFAQSEIGCRAHVPNAAAFAAELAVLGARTSWPEGSSGSERVGDDWLPGTLRYALPDRKQPWVRKLFDSPPAEPARSSAQALLNHGLQVKSTLRRHKLM